MAFGRPLPDISDRDDMRERRAEMVARQIERRGVTDRRVLDAMREVPRTVRPALDGSYEALCREAGTASRDFLLDLRPELHEELRHPRLERAIGVIYRPESELASHYFEASLPQQFDLYVWFEETSAVQPLAVEQIAGAPETYPFAL